jgi:hypothetical protein
LAATNRWLTAADACVARRPTKLAFCSRFRRQRKMPVDAHANALGKAIFFGLWGYLFAGPRPSKKIVPQSTKGRR